MVSSEKPCPSIGCGWWDKWNDQESISIGEKVWGVSSGTNEMTRDTLVTRKPIEEGGAA